MRRPRWYALLAVTLAGIAVAVLVDAALGPVALVLIANLPLGVVGHVHLVGPVVLLVATWLTMAVGGTVVGMLMPSRLAAVAYAATSVLAVGAGFLVYPEAAGQLEGYVGLPTLVIEAVLVVASMVSGAWAGWWAGQRVRRWVGRSRAPAT